MRIVAGRHRSRRLAVPAGRDVRPTSDRAREAVFASLGDLTGARVLALFAGSGALGLEALSRGAASCVFVERDRTALAAIRANVAALGEEAAATVRRGSATTALRELAEAGAAFDLVLLDPPYGDFPRLWPRLAEAVPAVLASDGRVVVEGPAGSEAAMPGFEAAYNRRVGAAGLVILTRA
ncbi:MAG: 16S rRNA (guanine(966)-N(2))-methyltransferase RsmD [Actinomycetota bacterium]